MNRTTAEEASYERSARATSGWLMLALGIGSFIAGTAWFACTVIARGSGAIGALLVDAAGGLVLTGSYT